MRDKRTPKDVCGEAMPCVKYIQINRSRQLALDVVVDTDVDYTSNDAFSSLTYYLLFSSVFLSFLI